MGKLKNKIAKTKLGKVILKVLDPNNPLPPNYVPAPPPQAAISPPPNYLPPPLPQANVQQPQTVVPQTQPQTTVSQLTGETVAYWILLNSGMTSDQILNNPG